MFKKTSQRWEIIPNGLAGIRYYANENFYLDGRFVSDILAPTEEDDQVGSITRNTTFYLGMGVRF